MSRITLMKDVRPPSRLRYDDDDSTEYIHLVFDIAGIDLCDQWMNSVELELLLV